MKLFCRFKSFYILGTLALLVLFVQGCKQKAPAALKGAVLEYIESHGIMNMVHQDELRICLVDLKSRKAEPTDVETAALSLAVPVNDRSYLQEKIKSALNLWLAVIKDFSGKPVLSKITFLGISDGCYETYDAANQDKSVGVMKHVADLHIFSFSGRKDFDFFGASSAFVFLHSPGKTLMALDLSSMPTVDGIVTHEMGHVLGLDDMYNRSDTTPGVMNNTSVLAWNGSLYPDDITTVKFAYCGVYYEKELERCKKLGTYKGYGSYPAFNTKGEYLYQLSSIEAELENSVLVNGNGQESNCVKVSKIKEGSLLSQSELKNGDCISLDYFGDQISDFERRLKYARDNSVSIWVFAPETLKKKNIKIPLVPNGSPVELDTSAVNSVKRENGSVVVGDVIRATKDVSMKIGSQISATIPEGRDLTVLKVQKDGATLWAWVSFFGKNAWVDTKDFKLIQ